MYRRDLIDRIPCGNYLDEQAGRITGSDPAQQIEGCIGHQLIGPGRPAFDGIQFHLLQVPRSHRFEYCSTTNSGQGGKPRQDQFCRLIPSHGKQRNRCDRLDLLVGFFQQTAKEKLRLTASAISHLIENILETLDPLGPL